jgi:DNA-binding CsgD family transcriptional regulator
VRRGPCGGAGDPVADRAAMMRRGRERVMSHDVGESRTPAVLAFDAHGHLLHHSASATALLAILLNADVEEHRSNAPASVAHVVHALGGAGTPAVVHARDGRAYMVRVLPAAAHDDGPDAPSTFVVIDASTDASAGDTLAPVATVAQRYGLSPREGEILRRVARGDATKAIAAALGLSAHTVQEYVGRACRKAGVRTRRELVARLLEDE